MPYIGMVCLILQLLLFFNSSASAQTGGQRPGSIPADQTLTLKLHVGTDFFLFIPRPGGTAYYWDFDAQSSSGNVEVIRHEVRVLRYPSSEPQVGSADGDLFEFRGVASGQATIVFEFRQYRQEPISRIRMETKIEQ